MEEGKYFVYNKKILAAGKLIVSADSRGLRFGDGLFETMRMVNENIPLINYHFERLVSSLQLLKFQIPDYFTVAYLSGQIKKIAVKNNHASSARIRLTIFRGNGGLYEYENNFPHWVIQTWKLNTPNAALYEKGLETDFYTKARKTCDDFSHIKSNNYLPYAMAALWAKENKLDEAILLNTCDRIAEATIANIFMVKDGMIKTPALSEGCVSGVMRRYLLKAFQKENIPFDETTINIEEAAAVNEIFITNAVQGIRWVKRCGKYNYSHGLSEYLYQTVLLPLFAT